MDRQLSDDMVKLVRYTLLNIERDQETILGQGEEIVTDNLSDEAFSSWMIAKHEPPERREPGKDASKYLRVSYDVLGRWPKQDRKFEMRQLEVLGDIRYAIRCRSPRASPSQPFRQLLDKIEKHGPMLASWRQGFERCHDVLGRTIAATFNQFRGTAGGPALELDADHLAALFKAGAQGQIGLDPAILDRFAGRVWGELVFRERSTGQRSNAWPSFAVWDAAREQSGVPVQKATLSSTGFFPTDATEAVVKERPDVMVNVLSPQLGFVAWRSKYLPARQEMPFICYRLADDQLLWINQTMSENLVPFEKNVFLVSLRWAGEFAGKAHQLVTSFSFAVDFDAGTAEATDDTFYTALYTVGTDPFVDLVLNLRGQERRLAAWRSGFANGKGRLAAAIAAAFASCREVGDPRTMAVTSAEIEAALASATGTANPSHPDDLDRFAGSWTGLYKTYDIASGDELSAIRKNNVWTTMQQNFGGWIQRVAGSEVRFYRPDAVSESLARQVDLVIDFFDDRIGLASWVSLRQHERSDIALIGYSLGGGRFLWAAQAVEEKPEPSSERSFAIALEWVERAHGRPRYYLVLLVFDVDLSTGEAKLLAPTCSKGTFERVED
jgi:hypothetical protein